MSEFYPAKKEVSRGMLTVTNKIESNAAFAVLHGSGAGVYIPERILAYLADGFASTREVCAAMPDKDSLSVSNRLNSMFAKRLLAKADVYSSPDQTRASFCLWAVNVQAFVEGVGDDA